MRVGIALGSNLGNRHVALEKAILNLHRIHEKGDFIVSSLTETDPVDCPPESPAFLNAVVELETSLSPLTLLHALQEMEKEAGRSKDHAFHSPRTLDLDILYHGSLTLDHPELKLPHPRITERHFVLEPLAEIRPDLLLPGWSQNCNSYLYNLHNNTI